MEIALLVLKYVTILPALIQGVEGLFTKGSDKKAAVVESSNAILKSLIAAGVVSEDTAAKFPEAISPLIDAFVAFYNATGVFQKKAAK